jgi:hypothetical protein
LLDSTVVVFGSCFKDGNHHDREDLPILLIGGRSHGLRPGREIRFERPEDQHLGNLWLTLGQGMGLDLQQVGNSVHAVPDLLA